MRGCCFFDRWQENNTYNQQPGQEKGPNSSPQKGVQLSTRAESAFESHER